MAGPNSQTIVRQAPAGKPSTGQETPEARIARLRALRAGHRQQSLQNQRERLAREGPLASLPVPCSQAPSAPKDTATKPGRTPEGRRRIRPSRKPRLGLSNTKQVTIPGQPDVKRALRPVLSPAKDQPKKPYRWSRVKPVDLEERKAALAELPLPKPHKKIPSFFPRHAADPVARKYVTRKIKDGKFQLKSIFHAQLKAHYIREFREELAQLAIATRAEE